MFLSHQDLLQARASLWSPCPSLLLSLQLTACPHPVPMATTRLPTPIRCLITWRARCGEWTWTVLCFRYVTEIGKYWLFVLDICLRLWVRHFLLYLPLLLGSFSPSVPATASTPHAANPSSIKPYSANPTSSSAHDHQHPIFPWTSQYDLCAGWWPDRTPSYYTSTNTRAAAWQNPTPCTQDSSPELKWEQPQWLWSSWWTRSCGQALPFTHAV